MSNPTSKHTPQPVSSKTTYALGALAVVVVAVIVFALFQWNRGGSTETRNDGYGPAHDPALSVAMDSDGGIVLGKPGIAKTIDVYEDPLCPACGQMERIYGQEIAQNLDEGKFAVRYRMVNFLDPRSGSKDYSTRAIAAFECVAQTGSGPAFAKFHDRLFTAEQPEEGGSDLDNQRLAAIAKESGASDDAVTCITKADGIDTAGNHAEAAMKSLTTVLGDRAATPTVLLDGKKLDVNDDQWVVDAAK
ncbi:DsbA family protein [Nocardia crassostreae]|uniref:DsbA family protein n=1 Tax=Nocardia crassostreae TaxID=53428 RepID=UPI000829DB49|nr:thioredoxin domain-containing protein [Nocardia crassostreae]